MKKIEKMTQKFFSLLLTMVIIMTLLPTALVHGYDDNKNVELFTRVRGGDSAESDEITEAESGKIFWVESSFAFYPMDDSSEYVLPVIKVKVPENVETEIDPTLYSPDIIQACYEFYDQTAKQKYINFIFASPVAPGLSGTVAFKARFKNTATKNGETAVFESGLAAKYLPNGESATREITAKTARAEIRCLAAETWETRKSVVAAETERGTGNDKDKFFVTYEIMAGLASVGLDTGGNPDTSRTSYDSFGRLAFDTDSAATSYGGYLLSDKLPDAPVPDGGATFVSLEMVNEKGTRFPLHETTATKPGDYKLALKPDGSLDSVAISKHLTAAAEGHNDTPAGYSIENKYYLKISYPNDKYATPSNQDAKIYDLVNTAELKYKLIGESERTTDDNASVKLGWPEDTTKPVRLELRKYIKLGDENARPLDAALASAYGKAQFTLYSDMNGTIATDIKNNAVAPVETSTVMSENPSGVLAFENLRFGTYYIKETLIPTGFAKSGDYRYVNSDYIEVAIASDGTVSFKDAKRAEKTAKQLEVVNQATEDGVGAILFYKKGQGFEDTAAKVLSGVQFTLCDKDGAAIQKNGADFTAISDAAGLVRFEGVPASKAGVTYTIKETSVPEAYSGKGFNGINPSTISVTLKGGEIKTVGLDVVNGVGTVTNTSTLGKFSFTKVDATDSAKRLAGAVFELHKSSSRPAGESTKIAEITVPAGGVYTSELLEAGKYWLREKSAPAGYSIEKNTDGSDIWYSVDVSPRTTTALAENIKNVPYGTLALLKYGRWGTTAGFDGTQIGLNFLALEGIEFTVRPCDKSGTVAVGAASYAITTVIDATGKASYSLSDGAGKPINDGSKGALLLPAGFYLVSEVESSLNAKYPNSGYNVLAPFVVEVNGGSKTEQLVYNDTDYGRIRIIKKDNLGTKLANVEFDIYYSDGTLADTVKTGNDGIAYSRQLASDRTYYIEERAISNDFEPIERITGISDPDGNHEGDATFNKQGEYISLQSANHGVTVTINVTNFRHVSVKVIKRDSDTLLGKTVYLEGAKFDLYDSATGGNKLNTEPFTTLADGSFIINGLIPSTDYWIEEIGAPTAGGYIIPSGRIMIKTNTGVATVPVDNTRYAHLEILKQGDFGGTTTALAGAEFNVYRDSVSSPVLGTIVTSADGHGTLLDSTGNPVELVAGKYVLVETKAPADYKIDTTPIEVVLKSGDNTVYYKGTAKETVKNAVKKISNAPDYGKIRIKKVSSADTGHGIKAIFNVYAATPLDSVNYDMSKAVGTIETEHWNGIGVSGKLKEGNYKLVEVTVKPDPDGQEYVIGAANSFECSVVAGQITGETAPHVFENQPKGKIKVVKEGVWTDKNGNLIANIPLSGAEFELYEQNGARVSWLDSNGTAQSVLVTDSNGEAMTGYIAPGSYTVKEIKAPDGYDLAAGAERAAVINVTDQQTKIVTVRFENKPYVGRLTIAKIDRSLNLITTGKAKFEIYRTLLTGEIPRDTVTYNGKELVLVKAVSTTGGRVTLNDLPVFKTDGDRASGNLEYFVKEIEAPSGYKFTQEWTGPVVLAAGSEVEHSVVDYSQTAGVGASKVDQDGRGLANAYISLFESKDEADKVNAYLAANPLNPSGDVAAQIKALKTAYPEIKDVQKSDKNGKFAFKGLTDAIYYALEIVPSVNYTRSDTVYTIKVVMAGKVAQLIDTVTNKPLSIVNIEYGRIKIKKQGYLGSSYVEDINGATFTVYKAAGQGQGNCLGSATAHVHDSSCRYTKGGEVKLNFTVSDGQYFSAPLPAGDYIVAETKAPAGYEMDPGAVYEWHVRVDSGTNSPNTWLFANPVSNYWNGGRFTFKKVSSISATTKVDASFKLFKMENGLWTEQETFQTRNGSYTSRLLPLGKYKIVECASIGYTVPSGAAGVREFEISIKGTTVDLHTITNDPQASIKLKKTGLFAPQNEARNLAGVTFGLFASEQEARAAKEDSALYKSTTLADGSATFIGIDAKTEANGGTEYWLGEISVGSANTPEFSTAWFTPFAIKVYAGQALNFGSSKSLNVVNDTHYGKLLIKKVDKNDVGTMLPGAVFELLTKNLSGGYDEVRVGNVKMTITTESSGAGLGTGMSGLLPAGEYYLRETAAPIGYKPDATINGPFTVSTNQITDTTGTPITNEKYQSVRIKKVSTYDSGGTVHERGPLGGIQFGIYATKALAQQGDHAAALQLATTVSTAGAGQGWATFSKLDPNTTYYIRELYAPAKYLMSDKVFEVTTDNLGSRDVAETAVNVERGSLEIRKVGKWKTQDSTGAVSEQMIPLDGAEFALFTNSADIIPISGTTQKTANGRCVWNDLIPGTYYIKETATVYGFAQSTEVFKATVTSGGATDVLEGKTDNVIENSPNKGKFIVEKQGSDGTHPAINGATFELYKKNSAGVYEKFVPETSTTGRTHTFTVSGEKINGTRVEGVYISEYVPVGDYKIIETESPKGYVTQLDSSGKPMEYFFKVDAGITSAPVVVRNDAKSDILITKRGAYDRTNSNATKVRVSGAEFKLYEKSDPATEIMTSTDNKDGSYSFSDVCPGEYIVKETKAPQGYDLNPAPICIDVLFGATANAVFKGEIVDFTNAGKIKVIKQDKDTHANLAGAEFEIYKAGGELVTWLDGNGNTVSKLVTDTSGEALSGMIPAQAGGTVYNVIETKAPAGYSLDPRIVGTSAQRQQITVYPVHTPSASVNTLSFMNGKGVDEKLFPSGISKKIVSPDPNVEQRSLMFEQREVCFGIYDYTNAQNPLPLENFTVTDNFTVKNAQGVARTLVFEYEQTPDNWVNIAPKNGDFDITEVRIYKASDSTDGRIDAIVEYQTFAALGSAEPSSWLSFSGNRAVNLQNLTEKTGTSSDYAVVDLSKVRDNVMGLRIRYIGTETNGAVGKNFSAAGFDFKTVFAKRSSDPRYNEVIRLTNTAQVDYSYTKKDQTGLVIQPHSGVFGQSNPVLLKFRSEKTELVPVELKMTAPQKSCLPGDQIDFTVTAKNASTKGYEFGEPLITVDLPAYTALVTNNSNFSGGGIFTIRDGFGAPLAARLVRGEMVDTGKKDSFGEAVFAERLVFILGEAIPAGGSAVISFGASIDYDKPASVHEITCESFLTSGKRMPRTAENPLGIGFYNNTPSGTITPEPSVDQSEFDALATATADRLENRHILAETTVNMADQSKLTIVKQVKSALDSKYLNAGEIANSFPGGRVDYKLSVTNYTSDTKTMRIVDVLPFFGDSYVVRLSNKNVTARHTELGDVTSTAGVKATYNLASAIKTPENAKTTVYYYLASDGHTLAKAERIKQGYKDEFPMLYSFSAAGGKNIWDGWTTNAPKDSSDILAVGYEVTYDTKLNKGDSCAVEFSINMPEFTALGDISDFYEKLISNSAAATARPFGSNSVMLPVENNEVLAYMRLPVGALGDYVWRDVDSDGIQNPANDIPIEGMKIGLTRTEHKVGNAVQTFVYPSTTTDRNGYYKFENLPANLPRDGAPKDSKNPADYIGNVYVDYEVTFGDPSDGLVPTLQNQESDDAIDSDIDANRKLSGIALNVVKDMANRTLTAERNWTIDAGFAQPCSLGDFVWEDVNRDGVQNDDGLKLDALGNAVEIGVNGVLVLLYRVDASGNVGTVPIATQYTHNKTEADGTDSAGYYLFEGLVPGKYVVEFDTSMLIKDDGYTPKYSFTTAKSEADNAVDSDASKSMDPSDTVRRTDVIELSSANSPDLRYDAGLVVLSGLGGFIYDDTNYNNIQDLRVTLPGTIVTLYKDATTDSTGAVLTGMKLGESMVGADGKYFFGGLVPGDYTVHFKFPLSADGVPYGAVIPNIASGDPNTDYMFDSDCALISSNRNSGSTKTIKLGYDEVQYYWDAGARLYSGLGDYVWFDTNYNGIQDAGEKPTEGIRVTLQYRDGTNGIWVDGGTTATDANGRYEFNGLWGGLDCGRQYRVIFLPEVPGSTITYEATQVNAGSDSKLDSDAQSIYITGYGHPTVPIILGYGKTDPSWDMGLVTVMSALGDYVWFDSNRNGVQDNDEMVLEGILCMLEMNNSPTGDIADEKAWVEVARQYTGKSGQYYFDNLREGYYRVRFAIPNVYSLTRLERGNGNGAFASDSDGIYQTHSASILGVTRTLQSLGLIRVGAAASAVKYGAPEKIGINNVVGSGGVIRNREIASQSGVSYYHTRTIYLNRNTVDLSWDLGVYTVQTSDWNDMAIWVSMGVASMALLACLWVALDRRKKELNTAEKS